MKNIFSFLIFILVINITKINAQWVKLTSNYASNIAVQGDTILIGLISWRLEASTNNGKNWFIMNSLKSEDYISSIAIKGNEIYVGTGTNFYYSRDFGNNWKIANIKWKGQDVHRFVLIEFYDNIILTYSDYFGCFLSSDKGENWSEYKTMSLSSKLPVFYSIRIKDTSMLARTIVGLFLSHDKGLTWNSITTKLQDGLPYGVGPYAYLFLDSIIFVQYGYTLLSSTNEGKTWEVAHSFEKDSIKLIELSNCGEYFYATTEHHGLLLSTNFGKSWAPVNNGLETLKGTNLPILKNDKYLIICMDNDSSGTGGVYRAPLKDCMIDTSSTAVAEPQPQPSFAISPNPAGENISIRHGLQSGSVAIYNLLGEKVYESNIEDENPMKIDVSAWRSGVYLCVVRGGSSIITEKVVIAR
ncbi:MAG: two component regulator propeller domain protein [Ignavibacteria bacterium]|nr:two component regulator propeller domain protein [Ignavibacteria bacterium]